MFSHQPETWQADLSNAGQRDILVAKRVHFLCRGGGRRY